MPLYDYKCSECKEVQEVMHLIDEPGPTLCPVCNNGKMKKVFLTTPSLHGNMAKIQTKIDNMQQNMRSKNK